MPEFIHLHNHSHYSLLDAACKVDSLIAKAVEHQMPSVALTDHGVTFGALEFYKKARKAGIKPIIGCEVYMADGPRSEKALTASGKKKRNYFHLILLAKDLEGYRNLCKLTSRAHVEGFYYKPRIDRELLQECHQGLVALSACAGGVVSAHLVNEDMEAAREAAIWYRELFGEDFYLEVQDHGIPVDKPVLEGMPILSRELNIPLVATNDCHYSEREHAIAHNVLLHIRDASKNGVRINVEEELRYGTANYYFKSADEMAALLGHFPGAIENTLAIAEKCNVELPHEFYMPKFPIPETSEAKDLDGYLREITWQGIAKRYDRGLDEEVTKRTEFELDVITRMGYSGYFLIVQDFIQAARERGVSVGPGRGSAAGSLVAFALGITNVDPIKYDLLFERFLNPDRVSMPDIDIDFADNKREIVIDYVKDKYGHDAVSQIITFGTLSSRAVLKDVGRVLGIAPSVINSITEKITVKFGRVQPISEAIEGPELRWVKESTDPQIRKLIEYSQVLEGMCRNTSLHAAGVVIAPGPLENYIPLFKTPDSGLASQYTMNYLEEAGLLKMDFLGLRTLTIIDNTLELIKQRHGVVIAIDSIPLDDEKTYELVGKGLTTAVFQFESIPMQEYLKQLKPESLEDLTAMNALYRPGPMENIPEFIDRKQGRKEIEYLHPMLEPILGKTYGICVYQESIMQIAQQLGGFTLAQADTLRRAMGKKQIQYMNEMKEIYFEGTKNNGIDKKTANDIWDMMVKFADYGFNKCVSADTDVTLPDGTRMEISRAYKMQPQYLMSMWPDGEIRPHRVQKIVRSGRKQVFKIRTASGRTLKATAEHRLLTTAGYMPIERMSIGTELMTAPRITDAQRRARRESIIRLNRTRLQRQRASTMMREYQATRPIEAKIEQMKRMHELHPDLTRHAVAAMHERLKELWATDPEFRQRHMTHSLASVRACYDSGPGSGRCSIASNGMWCASQNERDMCEWLIEQGIEFGMHKVLANGRLCDFYFAGIYWEMDGMDRTDAFFAEKYGELPYVVVTPEDYKTIVSRHLQLKHVENGDPIISIEPYGEVMTYDIEMSPDGPLNYLANGIVSHNSHSLAYSYVAYPTAWLKANYTPEFLAANMTAEANDLAKVVKLIDECRKFDIKVLPPDVNESQIDFSVVDEGIRFGMAAIRNVGAGAVAEILKQREKDGPFTSLFNFSQRLAGNSQINKRLLESLILAGAFDSLHPNRRQCHEALDSAVHYASSCAASTASGMDSLFAVIDESGKGSGIPEPALPNVQDWGRLDRLRHEKEVLNFYVSGHPLQEYLAEVEAFTQIKLGEVEEDAKFTAPVRACGIISAVRTKLDRRENQIAFVTIEDFTGKAECIFWSDAYKKYAPMLAVGEMVWVIGKAEMNGADGVKIIADDVIPMAQARSRFTNALAVDVLLDEVPPDAPQRTFELFRKNNGDLQCIFRIYDSDRQLAGRWVSRRFTVTASNEVFDGLVEIYGKRNVKLLGV
jgi:DNA-directed DNA polymerase III PolC